MPPISIAHSAVARPTTQPHDTSSSTDAEGTAPSAGKSMPGLSAREHRKTASSSSTSKSKTLKAFALGALAVTGSQGADIPSRASDLADFLIDANGAVNATALGLAIQTVSPRSVFDAINLRSTCAELVKESDPSTIAGQQACLKTLRTPEHELREPTESEMALINEARHTFALQYEKFLDEITAREGDKAGFAIKPLTATFRKLPQGEKDELTYVKPGRGSTRRAYVFSENASEQSALHELVHGHTHDGWFLHFDQNPAVQEAFLEAATQFINRHTFDPDWPVTNVFEAHQNSDAIIRNLLIRADLAVDAKDAVHAGLRALQDAFYLGDLAVSQKLADAMELYAKQALKDRTPSGGPRNAPVQMLIGLGLLAFAVYGRRNQSRHPEPVRREIAPAGEPSTMQSTPSEALQAPPPAEAGAAQRRRKSRKTKRSKV